MRRIAWLLLAGGVLSAGLAWSGWLGHPVALLPRGDQEVAWIHAATSAATWERFVTGIQRVRHEWPQLIVDDSRAYLDQTTAVPEVVLGVPGCEASLHIRWYKLTSDTDSGEWVKRLARRETPPLAFIGGGTSDRAVELARALADQRSWPGPAPLLLVTTATANSVFLDSSADSPLPGAAPTPLMAVYPERSFRFCFTNRQMAQAVVDFLWSQRDLRPSGDPLPTLAALANAALSPWPALPPLAAQSLEFTPQAYALSWDDDPYSIDLSSQFHEALHQPRHQRVLMRERRGIPYSVGDFYRPNAWEAIAADHLLGELRSATLERRVLVLPAAPAPARRVLRALTGAMPLVGRNLVAITGDSLNVNTIYRDADIAWNIRSVPVPLVFFTHQNPVAWDIDPNRPSAPVTPGASAGMLLPPNGTDDVLMHRDLVRKLVEAAFLLEAPKPSLLRNADTLAERLRSRHPGFFDDAGDRQGGRGEHVVVLRPLIDEVGGGPQVLSSATLEVWARERDPQSPAPPTDAPADSAWKLLKRLVMDYGRIPSPLP